MNNFKEILKRVKELNKYIIVRKAEIDDADIFVELFNKNYKRKTNSFYYKWQFFNDAYPSALFLAFESGELIGFHGVKVYNVTNLGKVAFAIDFLIHEKARKKGVAVLLDEYVRTFCLLNNVKSITALPNSQGNAAFRALGYKSLSKIDTLVYDLNFNSFDRNIDITYLKNESTKYSYYKDQKYINWRFELNPIYDYEHVQINEKCYAYIKVFTDPISRISCGDIVHVIYDDFENLIKLVQLCIQKLKIIGISSLTIWAMPHSNLFTTLAQFGFVIQQQERYFCVRDVVKTEIDQLDFLNWTLEESDAEIY